MFYLVSFLTLLISLLIYMMDPAPVQVRQKLDTRSGEAYIVGFVNQHQAARDYLDQWMNRVYYDSDKIQILDDSGVSKSHSPNARALALPAEMEDSLPLQVSDTAEARYEEEGVAKTAEFPSYFSVERWTKLSGDDPDGVGYLKFETGENIKGSYMSAVVCLNADSDLVPCYQYVCSDGVTTTTTHAGEACGTGHDVVDSSVTTGGNLIGVKFASGVTPYVVTYSDNAGDPDWWGSNGNLRALRHEAWRRALANRTHSTPNCGIISEAWGACNEDPKGRWERTGRRVEFVADSAANANHPDRYCINNGNRCMRLLSTGMRDFLQLMMTQKKVHCENGSEPEDTSLSGVLFCISEIKDVNAKLGAPEWHFDGIDNKVYGANERLAGEHSPAPAGIAEKWYASGSEGLGKHVAWDEGSWGSSYYGIDTRFALGPQTSLEGIVMPFNQETTDFTLNVVMNFGQGLGLNDNWYIGTVGDLSGTGDAGSPSLDGAYGLYIDQTNKIYFFPNRPDLVPPVDITDKATPESLEALLTGVHSWTIVRKDGKMLLYVDSEHVGDEYPAAVSVAPNKPVIVGKTLIGIGDVRYYRRALSEAEIKRYFKVDSKRYGAQKTVSWE